MITVSVLVGSRLHRFWPLARVEELRAAERRARESETCGLGTAGRGPLRPAEKGLVPLSTPIAASAQSAKSSLLMKSAI
jgi:hypothetical protein